MILVLCIGTTSFAQINLDFGKIGSSFELDFNSGYACKVDPSFSGAPTLGYGATESIAKANAINNCIVETGNHQMHCKKVECTPITFDSDKPKISISNNNGRIGVFFSYGVKATCIVKASFGEGLFYSEASSKLEAEVYAQRVCMGQTGNARMHCDEIVSCEQTEGISGGTKNKTKKVIGGILKDIFNN